MKKNKKGRSGSFHWILIPVLLIVMASSALCASVTPARPLFGIQDPKLGYVVNIVTILAVMVIALWFEMLLHEAGHLVFGLMTGYRFVSFRIGNVMWMRAVSRIVLKRMRLQGTGGQCLMAPPETGPDGKRPYKLYLLGGVLMNLLTATLFALLAAFAVRALIPFYFLVMASGIGFALALMNGVPIRDTIDNDGYSYKVCRKSPDSVDALWMQLYVAERQSAGDRLIEMPEEWFRPDPAHLFDNGLTVTAGVFTANRLMDAHSFDEARAYMLELLDREDTLPEIFRNYLHCDLLFCELIGQIRRDWINMYMDDRVKLYLKTMPNAPSTLRFQYAWEMLHECNDEAGEAILDRLERVAAAYPYEGEIRSEYELIGVVKKCL